MAELVIVDGNNLLMRSVHAMYGKTLSSSSGTPTGPLMTFIGSLSSIVKMTAAKRLVVCWDSGRSARRLIISSEYKANRKTPSEGFSEWKDSTFDLVKRFLDLAGIRQVQVDGVEADDLVAHFWRHRNQDKRSVIVSNDKDFLQLLDPGVAQLRPSSANVSDEVWTHRTVEERMGIAWWQVPFYLALVGDVSDNVAGVPRIGPKRARTIIQERQEWEGILEHPSVSPHREAAITALFQVDLRTPMEEIEVDPQLPLFRPVMSAEVMSFLARYELERLRTQAMTGSLFSH